MHKTGGHSTNMCLRQVLVPWAHQIEQKAVSVEEDAVVGGCDGTSNVSCSLNLPQRKEGRVLLDGLSDEACRLCLSLCPDDGALLVLLGLVNLHAHRGRPKAIWVCRRLEHAPAWVRRCTGGPEDSAFPAGKERVGRRSERLPMQTARAPDLGGHHGCSLPQLKYTADALSETGKWPPATTSHTPCSQLQQTRPCTPRQPKRASQSHNHVSLCPAA